MAGGIADFTLRGTRTEVADFGRANLQIMAPPHRAVLLIHGYNVDEKKGAKVLGEFRTTLGYFAPELVADTFTCTWAGNWDIWGVRPAAYPFMIENAKQSAKPLLDVIRTLYQHGKAPPRELIIIAHSM